MPRYMATFGWMVQAVAPFFCPEEVLRERSCYPRRVLSASDREKTHDISLSFFPLY